MKERIFSVLQNVPNTAVWNAQIIDKLTELCRQQHPFWTNMNNAAKCLVVMSMVYGKRVDALHQDVVRLAGRPLVNSNNERNK